MSWQCLVCLNKNVCPEATTDLVSIVNDMAKMDANLKPPCEAYEPGCEIRANNMCLTCGHNIIIKGTTSFRATQCEITGHLYPEKVYMETCENYVEDK